MKKAIKKQCRCAVCDKENEFTLWLGRYVGHVCMDGDPGREALEDDILCCPVCHYAAYDLEKPCSPLVKQTVQSAAYQSLFAEQKSPAEAAFAAAALLRQKEGQFFAASQMYLRAAWSAEGTERLAYRRKAQECMEQMEDEEVSPEFILMYLDNLRQLRQFERVKQVVRECWSEFAARKAEEPALYDGLRMELRGAQMGNSDPMEVPQYV